MYVAIILVSVLAPLALITGLIRKDHRRWERVGAYLSHPKGGRSKDEVQPIRIEPILSDLPFGGKLR